MEVEFAPLEGLTDRIYRARHRRIFGGADRYYAPFFSPTGGGVLTDREARQVTPFEADLVPQLLTKRPEDFVPAAKALRDLGYCEVDLNLGCPSGTVTAKGKGAALLGSPGDLRRLLDGIFRDPPCRVSVKTRLGLRSPEEFPALLAVFRDYPLSRLVIHPRTRDEGYRGTPHREVFEGLAGTVPFPVSCNGSFVSPGDAQAFLAAHPEIPSVMIGRGFLSDPALGRRLRGGPPAGRGELRDLVSGLEADYLDAFGSERNVLFRMKEHLSYLAGRFEDGETLGRKFCRAKSLSELRDLTGAALASAPLRTEDAADETNAGFNG